MKPPNDEKKVDKVELLMDLLYEMHPEIMEKALEKNMARGNCEMVQLFIDSRTSLDLARTAACAGNLKVIKYVMKNDLSTRFTSSAVNDACSKGHLDAIKFFKSQMIHFTAEAMDLAAENGHTDCVRWLHNNSIDYNIENAINKAAYNGQLATLIWLQENRKN